MTALIDETGAIASQYYYDAFGKVLEEIGTAKNPYRYAGYEYDTETGHYYLKSRYYNPKIARFISEDTYRGDIHDPLSLNLYTYCHNEPIMYVDPDGHWLVDAAFLVMDVVDFVKKPSLSKVAWVVADVASFADPSGVASTAGHAAKGIHAVVRTVKEAHAVTAAVKGVHAATDVVKGMKAVHAVKEVAATALEIGAHGEKEGKAVAKTIKLTRETTEATHSAAKATHSAQTAHSTVNVIKDTHSVAHVDGKVVKAEEKTAQEIRKLIRRLRLLNHNRYQVLRERVIL